MLVDVGGQDDDERVGPETVSPDRRQWAWYASALVYRWTETAPSRAVDRAILDHLGPSLEGARIMDCGCGPGLLAEKLAARRPALLLAVDANPAMAGQAKRRLGSQAGPGAVEVSNDLVGPAYFAAIEAGSGQEDYDVIIFKRSLYARPAEAAATIRAAARVLRPDGTLLVAHPERRLRRYAFGPRWPWWQGHTAYHLVNRALSRLAVLGGISRYQDLSRPELIDVLRTAAPDAAVEILDSRQRAYNVVALRPLTDPAGTCGTGDRALRRDGPESGSSPDCPS